MKKGFALLMAAVLSLSLCACGKPAEKDDTSVTSMGEEASAAVPMEETSSIKQVSQSSSKQSSAVSQTSDKKTSSAAEESRQTASSPASSVPESSVTAESSAEEQSSAVSEEVSEEPSEEVSEEVSEEPSEEESSEEVSEEPSEVSEEPSEEDSEPEESSRPAPKPQTSVSGETVGADWFDDAVFIGDSVTLKLSYYADYGSLGDAAFLCAGSLGYNNAQWGYDHPDNVHPVYNGVKVTVEDGVAMLQPKKIFIMLGMNDIGLYGVDGAAEGMKTLTAKMEQRCPDAVIYVQSVTPMLENMQLTDLNNTTIAEFDAEIESICQERGYVYLDVASAVDDGYGNLLYDYCSDPTAMGLHFSDAGCEAWVNYLKSHVA